MSELKNKIIKTLNRKKEAFQEVLRLYDLYNDGNKEFTINEINKRENEIKAQISILRHLLSD